MSLRHLLYELLTTTPDVVAVYGDRVIDAGNLGEESGLIPPFPFLVTRWGEERPFRGTTRNALVELWSYDNPRDYTRHGRGLLAVQAVLHRQSAGPTVAEGYRTWLIEGLLDSISRDLEDDVLRASVKVATYRLVGNSEVAA